MEVESTDFELLLEDKIAPTETCQFTLVAEESGFELQHKESTKSIDF